METLNIKGVYTIIDYSEFCKKLFVKVKNNSVVKKYTLNNKFKNIIKYILSNGYFKLKK